MLRETLAALLPEPPYCLAPPFADAPELCIVPGDVRLVVEGDAPKPPDTFAEFADAAGTFVLPVDGRAVIFAALVACAPLAFALDQSPFSPRL